MSSFARPAEPLPDGGLTTGLRDDKTRFEPKTWFCPSVDNGSLNLRPISDGSPAPFATGCLRRGKTAGAPGDSLGPHGSGGDETPHIRPVTFGAFIYGRIPRKFDPFESCAALAAFVLVNGHIQISFRFPTGSGQRQTHWARPVQGSPAAGAVRRRHGPRKLDDRKK